MAEDDTGNLPGTGSEIKWKLISMVRVAMIRGAMVRGVMVRVSTVAMVVSPRTIP